MVVIEKVTTEDMCNDWCQPAKTTCPADIPIAHSWLALAVVVTNT